MTPAIREIDNRSSDQRSEYERFLEERVKALQAEVVRLHELAEERTLEEVGR